MASVSCFQKKVYRTIFHRGLPCKLSLLFAMLRAGHEVDSPHEHRVRGRQDPI